MDSVVSNNRQDFFKNNNNLSTHELWTNKNSFIFQHYGSCDVLGYGH